MAEGPVPVMNLSPANNKTMMKPYGDVSNLLSWTQWWAAGKSTLPSPPLVSGAENPYSHDEPPLQDFVPNNAVGYTTTEYDSMPKQQYPEPPLIPPAFPGDSPVSLGSVDRRSSASSHPERRKRKRNTTERAAAESSGRYSSKKKKAPAAAEEAGESSKTRRKSQKTEAALVAPPPKEETDGYTQRIQERNRIASNKFRVKKREDAKKLKSHKEYMQRINRELSSCVANLTLEVYNLKMRLLQHTDCDCALIQDYIANEAHHYIHDLGQQQHSHN
ncbi:hypothetical protein NCS55_00000300 [Fusarium keratoplasticum]|nr:hypothetical protein NCS55_00000300 [Fusarium keratoplasticum]